MEAAVPEALEAKEVKPELEKPTAGVEQPVAETKEGGQVDPLASQPEAANAQEAPQAAVEATPEAAAPTTAAAEAPGAGTEEAPADAPGALDPAPKDATESKQEPAAEPTEPASKPVPISSPQKTGRGRKSSTGGSSSKAGTPASATGPSKGRSRRKSKPVSEEDAGDADDQLELMNDNKSRSAPPASTRPYDPTKQEYLYLSFNFVHQKLRAFSPPCAVELQLEDNGVMQTDTYKGDMRDSSAKGYYSLDVPPKEQLLGKDIFGLRLKSDNTIILQIKDRTKPLHTDEGRRKQATPRVIGITTSIRVDFLKQCFTELGEPRHAVNVKVEVNGVRQPELFTGASISHNRQGSFYVLGLPFALVHGRAFVAWRQLDPETLELAVEDVDPALVAAAAPKQKSASKKGLATGIVVDSRISIPLAMLKRDLADHLDTLLPGGVGPAFEIPIHVQYRVDGVVLERVYESAVIKKSEHRGCCYLNGTERIPVKGKLLCSLDMQPCGSLIILDFKSAGQDEVQRRCSPSIPPAASRPLQVPPNTIQQFDNLIKQISAGQLSAGMVQDLAAALTAATGDAGEAAKGAEAAKVLLEAAETAQREAAEKEKQQAAAARRRRKPAGGGGGGGRKGSAAGGKRGRGQHTGETTEDDMDTLSDTDESDAAMSVSDEEEDAEARASRRASMNRRSGRARGAGGAGGSGSLGGGGGSMPMSPLLVNMPGHDGLGSEGNALGTPGLLRSPGSRMRRGAAALLARGEDGEDLAGEGDDAEGGEGEPPAAKRKSARAGGGRGGGEGDAEDEEAAGYDDGGRGGSRAAE